jgi:drug/metabolite transporter (DMT)-like permease
MAASVMAPVVALQRQCMLGTLLLTPLAISHWSWPAGEALVLILAMGALSTVCHFLVIAAFRHAETAVLSPLIYLELVTAVAFGWFTFSELPGASAFIGIALIVAGGLAALLAERRRSSVHAEREERDAATADRDGGRSDARRYVVEVQDTDKPADAAGYR